jgi:predicted transposase YbfD/YdcC
MARPPLSFTHYFATLRDPRRRHRRRHLLLDIVAIALCATVAGAKDWQEIATFAQRRRAWLGTFLALPGGIPSHDTLERVFDRLDPAAFLACFQRWVEALAHSLRLKHIAIDGKTLRHSGDSTRALKPLHLVSAWATECQLSLGQVAVADKSNEITAIPQLLDLLDLHGALVTIDALGCQTEIAKRIIAGGGDYLLAVKGNQPNLLDDIQACMEKVIDSNYQVPGCSTCATSDRGHGRQESRSYVIVEDPAGIRDKDKWAGLRVVGMCLRRRTIGGVTNSEVHYFIGSRAMSVRRYAKALRGHWGIENNLHWQLDVSFGEDANRVQKRHGAENLALVRRLALSLLKRQPSKQSIACKQLSAALDTAFLEETLRAGCNLGEP